jgi:hypothetical protein
MEGFSAGLAAHSPVSPGRSCCDLRYAPGPGRRPARLDELPG